MRAFLQRVRRTALLHDGAGLTDGQLLECFIERQDAAAFEALVRFHGPMVLGVCRRVLNHQQDAEDAFQATFLVLARKSADVVPRERVGNWLYGVAQFGSVSSANLISKWFGLAIEDTEVPLAAKGDKFEVRGKQIQPDPLTQGIRELNFFRASPIRVTKTGKAKLLVTGPDLGQEGVAAVARSGNGELIVVTQSVWLYWIGQGADNIQFLENMFVLPKKSK